MHSWYAVNKNTTNSKNLRIAFFDEKNNNIWNISALQIINYQKLIKVLWYKIT